jgi:integrase
MAATLVSVQIGRKKSKRAKRIPTGEDLRNFLHALPDTVIVDQPAARLIVVTACVAGLRVSEVLGLQRRDIDAKQETLCVERRWRRGDEDQPKSEESKRVRQIPGFAKRLLAFSNGKDSDEFIFTRKDGRPLDDRDLQQHVFRPAAEAVGIYYQGFGMHVFRRLNVTWRQQAGASALEAQKAAGHSSVDMTMLYTQTDAEREREHVEKILERIDGADHELQKIKAVAGLQ